MSARNDTDTAATRRYAKREVLATLWAAAWKFRGRTALAILLLVAAKLAAVTVPMALKNIVDELSRPEAVLVVPVFLLLAYSALRFTSTLFSEIRDVVFARVTLRTVADFTLRAFDHLHRLGPRFHITRHTGALTRDVERGTAGIGMLLGVGLFTIVPTLVEIGSVMAVMIAGYSLWFTAIIAVTFLVYTAFTLVFTERRAIHQRALNELDSQANNRLVDSLLNYETVKYYTNEKFESKRFSSIMQGWIDVGVRNQKALTLLHIGQSGVIALGVAAVMLYAGQEVVGEVMTVGDLVLINAYVIQICLPLNTLGFVFREAKDALINAERMFRVLEQKPDIDPDSPLPPLAVTQAEVRFDHVDFGYEPSRQILWDVSLRIPPGGTVAVVGGSGSGKSTLARLLFRFYDPGAGRVLIDGQDIRAVSAQSLRAAIGIVPQDTILFNDTIAYNIAYGRAGATLVDVIEAARAAHVHDFIAALPEQYDTVVGERGLKLSGGEKQRIAIARAILKNPPVLVFDEATSALDTRAERAIQEELDRIAENRTTLVIAHRLSTVVNADEILVLEHGRVVERGNHAELLARNGLYAQMWAMQQQQRDIEDAGLRLAQQPVDLVALVENVVDGLKPVLDARGLNLYTVVGTEPMRVTGDPSRLQQAIWDICAHAVDCSPNNGRVELRLERTGASARLSVTHLRTPGIDTARNSQQRRELTGEPLDTGRFDVDRIEDTLEQHRGRLERHYDEPSATEGMALELPLRAVASALPAPSAKAGPVLGPGLLDGLNVLVVDDQRDARELLEALLESYGARVLALSSGTATLELFDLAPRSDWPDVIVCDIALGEESGYTVLARLRQIEAERGVTLEERLPAIALTGFARTEDRMHALMAGFQLHLSKPVDAVELVAAIASLARRPIGVPPAALPAPADRAEPAADTPAPSPEPPPGPEPTPPAAKTAGNGGAALLS